MPEIVHPIQTSFAKGELAPSMYGRVDMQYYNIGTRTMKNFGVHPQGGVSNLPGTKFVSAVKNASDFVALIPFEFSAEQAYVLEFGDKYMRVIKNKALVMSGASPYELVTPFTKTDVRNIRYTQSANIMFLTCPGFPPKEIARISDTSWTISDFEYENGPFFDENTDTTTLTIGAYLGSTGDYGQTVQVTASSALFSVNDVGRFIKIRYLVDSELLYRRSHDVNSTPWYSPSFSMDGTFEVYYWRSSTGSGATEFQYSRDNGTTWSTHSVLDESGSHVIPGTLEREDGDEYSPIVRFADLTGDPNECTIKLRKEREEKVGYIKITSVTSSTVVRGTVYKACKKLAHPIYTWSLGAWGQVPGYPQTVMFFQDRLCMANTASECNKISMSKTGDYNKYSVEVEVQDDDAITVLLPSRSVNAIHNLVPLGDTMLAFTSGGIWSVSPGSNSDALTPTSIKSRLETAFRAGGLPPLTIGNIVFYAQSYLNKVCSLYYSDASYGYDGVDMGVASNHLFENNELVDWTYQQEPWSSIWAARDDGVLLGFTFLKEQQVQAWYRRVMASGGKVEAVTVIPGAEQDDLYVQVARTINGNTVRYIECVAARDATTLENCWFVDCAVEYDSTPTTTISGLSHLIGCSVSGVADGVAFNNKTVSAGGTITLDSAASHVIVGLPYSSDLQTLDLEIQLSDGTAQGRKKRVGAVVLRLQNSKGGYVGPDENHLMPIRYPDGATFPFSGDVEVHLNSSYGTDGRVFIRQSDPYPLTINAIIPEVIVGG